MAALDQAKREADALAAQAPTPVPRPVTPPQEEVKPPTTPTRPLLASTASAAEVEAMLPPGQPRKTPTGKRVALEMLGAEEEDEGEASDDSMEDVKTNTSSAIRRLAPVTKQSRTMSPSGKTVVKTVTAVAGSPAKAVRPAAPRVAPATVGRVTRVSPRIQEQANARKAGVSAVVPPRTNGTASSSTLPARRAREEPTPVTRTRSGTQTQAQRPARPPSKIPSRKINRAASPPPSLSSGKSTPVNGTSSGPLSRLPTLIPNKRAFIGKSLTMATALPTTKSTGLAPVKEAEIPEAVDESVAPEEGEKEKDDAWMSGVDAMAAVDPGNKSGSRRPSIQRVRRRRSSFSSVDINI